MPSKSAALVLALLIAAAGAASAQSLTASLPSMGGVGITPNGTGFDGAMGDPDLFPAPSAATPAGTLGPAYGAPGTQAGRGYAPALPPIQYNWRNPYAR